ncbi:XamI family restriction endonuclease [Methylobacterium oryzihabitans]|uniref:XamI family restriction endonuclease n=1 Tax=Methylobacterium oryzihabitans TaxID=2499852 RepID=A0A3S2YR16_9HYPH|nr:XamI family restriction endonuclease [Methylobacterium oryzihabitans]RVU17473.1 XamI family restriction endonuclease [Methylobacterium oryzihabitans]
MAILPRHIDDAAKAKALYLDNLKPEEAKADWLFAVREARDFASNALRASNYLRDIAAALTVDARHSLVFRQLLSPPLSQDQFKLVCPEWSKTSENSGKALSEAAARSTATAIYSRLDYTLAPWITGRRAATRSDITLFLKVVAVLLAMQRIQTARRKRLANEQEDAVVSLLGQYGWTRLPSKTIDIRAAVPAKHFMHKTRFATATTTPQEVDIACGLPKTYVLAMECKVTNDETNSVKRINDVLKKAEAWKKHWGTFVITAALLQGVIAPKDVQRLTDADVEVFWSHDLENFMQWLAEKL